MSEMFVFSDFELQLGSLRELFSLTWLLGLNALYGLNVTPMRVQSRGLRVDVGIYWMSCLNESFCRPQVKENNYRGHGDSVDQLCWHPTNPDLFVTASGDKTIRIWDVRTTKCIATVNTKGGTLVHALTRVRSVVYSSLRLQTRNYTFSEFPLVYSYWKAGKWRC